MIKCFNTKFLSVDKKNANTTYQFKKKIHNFTVHNSLKPIISKISEAFTVDFIVANRSRLPKHNIET